MADPCKSYHCPECDHHLCQDEKIKLETVRSNNEVGELFLSNELGAFIYDHVPAVFFEKGEVVELRCPGCKVNLSSERFEGFSKVCRELESGLRQDVYISNEAGKRKLYLMSDSGLTSFQEK